MANCETLLCQDCDRLESPGEHNRPRRHCSAFQGPSSGHTTPVGRQRAVPSSTALLDEAVYISRSRADYLKYLILPNDQRLSKIHTRQSQVIYCFFVFLFFRRKTTVYLEPLISVVYVETKIRGTLPGTTDISSNTPRQKTKFFMATEIHGTFFAFCLAK